MIPLVSQAESHRITNVFPWLADDWPWGTQRHIRLQLKNYLAGLDDEETVSLFTLSNDAFASRMELGLQNVRDSLKLAVLQVFEERDTKQERSLVNLFKSVQKKVTNELSYLDRNLTRSCIFSIPVFIMMYWKILRSSTQIRAALTAKQKQMIMKQWFTQQRQEWAQR